MSDFCEQVTRLLQAAGVSKVRELSEIIGETPSSISTWNSRGRIPAKKIFPISQIVGCSSEWLISGEGSQYQDTQRGHSDPDVRDLEGEFITGITLDDRELSRDEAHLLKAYRWLVDNGEVSRAQRVYEDVIEAHLAARIEKKLAEEADQ